MSLRHGLQAIVRVVRRRVQQQAQQHTHGHAGRQKADAPTLNPAQHYHSSGPTGPNVVLRPKSQNLANRAAQVWRLTPGSWSRITLANGTRTVPSSRPVLPLLLGFAGIGFVSQDQVQDSPQDGEAGIAARSGIDLDTAIQVVQSVFKNRDLKPDHLMDHPFTEFPSKLTGYTLSKTTLAKGTEGVVFGAKKRCSVPSPEGDVEFADPCDKDMPMSADQQKNGGRGEQRNEELPICDDKECNLALKMMFNYNVGSTPADIMAEYEAEQLPLVMAGGTFCQSNKFKHERPNGSLRSSHPNIVLMHRAFVDDVRVPSLSSAVSLFDVALPVRLNPMGAGADTTMYIVMKRYRTSLRDYLSMECDLPDHTVMVIVAQLLEAVGYLGNQGVVHRDLKSNNILVDYEEASGASPHVVIADFGCALSLRGRNLQDSVSVEDRNRQGNSALMAPEVTKGYHHDCLHYHDYLKADAWAVGAIIYEVCGQKNPFYSDGVNSCGYEAGDLPQLQSQAVGLKIISKLLLQKDPGERPSAQVAANILHLLLWQPSVSSLLRLCHSQSQMDSELSAWIIKVSLMQLVQDQAEKTLPSTRADPGIPLNPVEKGLLETFLKRVNSGHLICATQHLVKAFEPLALFAVSSLPVGREQLTDLSSNADRL
ncbi:serine/threonine-protein kinase PINK1, mitochondrial isoform X2 [Strongylocentrotus purpuratus]|uniref:non-specific serine/threonine protein kinase n=1 Tax=Strongylocentrotus purpuratus TaxID=7668 RepID=A0A7M7NYN0_STRPU|nr:serine/threonine-protein kinase PINK1, mitochondrial isoform X2 [Strongylocentrotus purpuratus]